jgi:hypothetical protein
MPSRNTQTLGNNLEFVLGLQLSKRFVESRGADLSRRAIVRLVWSICGISALKIALSNGHFPSGKSQ